MMLIQSILSLSILIIYWFIRTLNGGGSPLNVVPWIPIRALRIRKEAASREVGSSVITLGHRMFGDAHACII
jgi:hypothetical protein